MKTPRTSSQASGRPRAAAASPHLQIAYQLDALLHTMRVLARAEEQLCSLMHGIERERTLPAHARRELLHLLQDLPTDTCDADRHAILDALGAAAAPLTRPTPRKATTRPAPTPPARKPATGKTPARKAAAPARSKAATRKAAVPAKAKPQRASATRRTTSAGRTAAPAATTAVRTTARTRATQRRQS